MVSVLKTNVFICTKPRFDCKFLQSKFLEFSTIGLKEFLKFQQIFFNLIYVESPMYYNIKISQIL